VGQVGRRIHQNLLGDSRPRHEANCRSFAGWSSRNERPYAKAVLHLYVDPTFKTGRPMSDIELAEKPATSGANPIDPGVRIGHVPLKVAAIGRSLAFYCGVLGFELQARYGTQAAFFSAGGSHHHFGINTWESKNGRPPARGTTGLYHSAILYP